jgi:hypothetical protein
MPKGRGRRETLKQVMRAILEGVEIKKENQKDINEAWVMVLAGTKKLEEFKDLVDKFI